jgi:Flp pilus assembly protein TadD
MNRAGLQPCRIASGVAMLSVVASLFLAAHAYLRAFDAKVEFKKGVERFRSADYHRASLFFRRSTELDPANAYYRGIYALSSAAEGWGYTTIEDNPLWSLAQARGVRISKSLDVADAQYTTALRQNPNDSMFLNNLAWISALKGDLHGAVALSEAAVSNSPQSVIYHVSLSAFGSMTGDRELFESQAAQAIQLSPLLSQSKWFKTIGVQCKECVRRILEKAANELTRARAVETNVLTDARLGAVDMELGKEDDGYRLLRASVEAMPNLSEAWCAIGRYLSRKGDLLGAQRAFRKGLFLDPGSVSARLGLCKLEGHAGEPLQPCEEALQWRYGGGLRSDSAALAVHMYRVSAEDVLADDSFPKGFLSYCCYIDP